MSFRTYSVALNDAETLFGVCHWLDSQVRIYNFTAMTIAATITTPSPITAPMGVDFDSSGNLYVSQASDSTDVVYRFSSAYTLFDTWGTVGVHGTGSGEFCRSKGVHYDIGTGWVLVADELNHRV